MSLSLQRTSALESSVLDTKKLLTASILRENVVATAMLEVQCMYDNFTAKLDKLQLVSPISVIGKTRVGQCG